MEKTPAKYVVETFGGVRAVSKLLDISTQSIYQWLNDPEGDVPSRHFRTLLEAARDQGLPLTAEHLIFGA